MRQTLPPSSPSHPAPVSRAVVVRKRPSAALAQPERGAEEAGQLPPRWPMLTAALDRYHQNVAEAFSREAYDCVMSGLIRRQERQRLGQRAEELGIRPFDAQLLLACAIRQWVLDQAYHSRPSREAPRLSFEYRAWGKIWIRRAILVGLALSLDGVLLWHWLK